MSTQGQELFKAFFLERYETLSRRERNLVRSIMERKHVTHNVNQEFDAQLTVGQRVADRVAAFGGSWTFIIIFGSVLAAWIVLNTVFLARLHESFDPYPYILLNLVLSMLAAIQAPVIMMSQNRQAAKDRLDAAHDYEVNLKSEVEIANLHQKLDDLREKQWSELVSMQQEQIRLLLQLLEKRGGDQCRSGS